MSWRISGGERGDAYLANGSGFDRHGDSVWCTNAGIRENAMAAPPNATTQKMMGTPEASKVEPAL